MQFSMVVLGTLCLINLAIGLRIVQRLRAQDIQRENFGRRTRSTLTVGTTAPPFRALTLTGQEITETRLAGRAVAFVFVSPNCGTCKTVLATLTDVAVLARRAAGVEVVVVSDGGAARTRTWLDTMKYEDDLTVVQPVLAAPLSHTPMILDLNPQGLFPYFCLLDNDRRIQAYGGVGATEWSTMLESWQTTAGKAG